MTSKLRVDAVLVQALIAGALSFAHLHDLAAAAGQTGWKAWAYPVSVDLLLVAAWRRLRSDGSSQLAWCWFLVSLFASFGANVATAGFLDLAHPPGWLRFGIAGWPAVAFLGGTLLAHSPAPTVSETHPVVESEPIGEMSADPERVPEPDAVAELEPTPPVPAPVPAVPVPAALVEHARKLAADHRARTGYAIDTDTLRARLGVPAPMADAIAAQLA
ncbi:DUF2637 domain-containing protein [Streptomyces sp. NPDC056943]|uniref:DUF2637 domain-containing protein n=1 Tax=Streptomyces sp. NPDC056943 TaxID=3345971 RepID=UPI00362737B0